MQTAGALTRAHTQGAQNDIPYRGRVGGCPYREACMVPVGERGEIPRSVLGQPCGFEIVGTEDCCPKAIRMGGGR